jgi:hypothetical protein
MRVPSLISAHLFVSGLTYRNSVPPSRDTLPIIGSRRGFIDAKRDVSATPLVAFPSTPPRIQRNINLKQRENP